MMDRVDGISLRSGLLGSVAKCPDAVALVVRDERLSYGELDATARRWAGAILDPLNRRAERVGVFGYRSRVSYIGALAALYSGAAFVPLNPNFTPEKTRSMIRQAALDAVIVDKMCAPQLGKVLEGENSVPLMLLPEFEKAHFPGLEAPILDASDLAAAPLARELPPLVPEDIAYMLFTSGSTGEPKGVPVTHGNACHFLGAMQKRYSIVPGDRFSQTFDQTFDLSVFDLFLAWHSGACVYSMASVDLLAPTGFINRNQLTVWFSVPSVAAQMRKRSRLQPNSLPTLRWSLFCGEPLPKTSAELWQAAAPASIVENLYGPTELTIACMIHRWIPDLSPALCHNEVVPIGRPIEGLATVLLDEGLAPVPPGEEGELCVSGPQTTPGYWKDPARTAERFVSIPVSDAEVRRFYRTGDRARRLENGEYVFIGRTDFQIKVLGHRVELGEVEAALRRDSRVSDVVAIGWPVVEGSAQAVVAFVVGDKVDTAALADAAKQSLPPWAVPKEIRILEAMPLNANGKIDRKALAQTMT
jgi:amino acid adenylation domain-containing protein